MARASEFPVLLVDDEIQFLQSAAITLRLAGFEVATCSNGGEVPRLVAERQFGAVLLDILMPGVSGVALLSEVRKIAPMSQVIMLTAVNDLETAVTCMRQGAFDYIAKPAEKERLVSAVRRAIDMVELGSENRRLKERLLDSRLESPEAFEKIVTRDRRMFAIFQYVEAIAATGMPVLIQGETGTGKELVAQAIHQASGRKGAFVSVNAAGLTDALFCDALFGHERGAFTGADAKRDGLVAKAAGGTLFLDEIGELPVESQVKLLRLIEERAYYPTGSDTKRTTDARFVVATNRDLVRLRKENTFRSDLYFRLEAHKVEIPPLRERKDDIPLLADTFMEEAAQQLNRDRIELPGEAYGLLEGYAFPGNVRELRNMIFDAASVTTTSVADITYFQNRLAKNQSAASAMEPEHFTKEIISRWPALPALKDAEQLLVDEALRRAGGNQTIAARVLGLTRSALNKRLTRAKEDGGQEQG
jgi:DNA-binding NtrC family response regulator